MAGKHTNHWYKKDYEYKENSDYVDKKFGNEPHNYARVNNGIGQEIQHLVGDERLVNAIQTLVERHTAEALKNLQEKLHTDPQQITDHKNRKHPASRTKSYDNPSYSNDGRYSDEMISDSRRTDLRTGYDLIEYFDPDNVNQNVIEWVDKIDHLSSIYNWTEYERSYYLQNRLTGAAKTWYNRLRSTDLSWQEWKNAIVSTFSVRHDYASLVAEILNRKKLPNESMLQYFNDKVKLCERCYFTNDKAVSFIIHGLPKEFQAEARAFRCWTPNELYDEFLSKLDRSQTGRRTSVHGDTQPKELLNDVYYSSHSTSHSTHSTLHKRHHEDNWDRTRISEDKRASKPVKSTPSHSKPIEKRRCYNCRKANHLSKDCPHPQKCRDCGSRSHKSGDCKLKSSRPMK